MNAVRIKNRLVGEGYPTYIIAEMSANHAGSIERAKEIIRVAKDCGADCIKIQTYTPDTITIDCDNEYFQIQEGTWKGENLYSLYGKAYTPWEWHNELKEAANKIGIDFFSTPFDKTSVDFLESIDIPFYKIASFELVDIPLIRYVASKGKPIIMSTGMGTQEEIREAVEAAYQEHNDRVVLLKCSSAYPALPDDMNLRTIEDMRERFNLPVGLSDHSLGSLSATTAIAMGASVIEKHFCLSRDISNPDASFSMTPSEFSSMVSDIRKVEKALGRITYGPSDQEQDNLKFRKSVFVIKDINEGEPFTEENLKVIRPGFGLKPKYFQDVLGKSAVRALKRGTPLKWEDIG
ncbi:MAG: pseudaminic acid synthase [Lachnospiraceae bacterium]|nr:pseudaminic acid synthase [Lachnospiraceae bacterium]